ncbi:hypothetical protein C6497_01485 [Candidatus Poribacteria bacterium]|nr:MAG: hypothetical protein C6497_01485 [Candidatus Poribacteria bacterium]
MKKFTLLIFSILILGIISYYFYSRLVINPTPILVNIPRSIPHEHVTPEGESIEHIHTYELSFDQPKLYKEIPTSEIEKKHPIQLEWERIDLDMIRDKYQPFTVSEMKSKWYQVYRNEFGTRYPTKLDRAYPQEKWLKQNLELGQPLAEYMDYRVVMQRRIYMVNRRDLWRVVGSDKKEAMRNSLQLPSHIDTWREYEEAYLKFWIIASYESLVADKMEVVSAYIVNQEFFSKFMGGWLSRKEKYDLMVYGVIPDGKIIVYYKSDGEILPPRIKPRYYERYMVELDQAQKNVDKMITDHQDFFQSSKRERRRTKLENPVAFSLLKELHWGEYPDDLQALERAISKLEKIRTDGEEKIYKR